MLEQPLAQGMVKAAVLQAGDEDGGSGSCLDLCEQDEYCRVPTCPPPSLHQLGKERGQLGNAVSRTPGHPQPWVFHPLTASHLRRALLCR